MCAFQPQFLRAWFVFSDDNLNFGIKTLEEIKLKKLKEKTKKQGGELIAPISFTSAFSYPSDIPWIVDYALGNTTLCTVGVRMGDDCS